MPRRAPVLLFLLALVAVGFPLRASAAESASPVASPAAQDRSVEPVVLTGAQFPGWSVGPEISAREPTTELNSDCPNDDDGLNHNCSQPSLIPNNPNEGAPVDRLRSYRWDSAQTAFVQVPFQVDERFTRYISNFASNCNEFGSFCIGFGGYSGADAQLSYVYDRDSYRFTDGVCTAEMEDGEDPAPDPVKGLDDNDELTFLYRDAGEQAPPQVALPAGIAEMRRVRIDDPSAPGSPPRYAYVGLASAGATPEDTVGDGYMRYVRDPDADRYDETSDNYGNAPKGEVCNDAGNVIKPNVPRRPRDTAWVLTPRYAFRYAGRWILRGIRVAPGDDDEPLDDPSDYGPPLIDQWKARAYAQRPENETPCCGFETEQDNWGGSSVSLGERWGPVRVIRATWGADSGTNTLRNEIFYPDMIVQQNYLRVHPIPPLGGIFAYWDHTAGVIKKYYNPQRPDGVPVDGDNDEVIGTAYVAVRPGGAEVRDDDPVPVVGPQNHTVGSQDGCLGECSDFDVTDPTHQATGILTWEQVSGDHGSMVFRTRLNQITPGGAQSFASIPYYRDDSCFDDGTGIDPGPHTNPKNPDPVRPCWEEGQPEPDTGFRQGLIGAHGVQVLFAAETDNLMLTVPATEISAETRMVVLPGDPGNVGEQYGHAADLPLQVTAADGPAIDPTTIKVSGDTSARMGETADLEATLTDVVGPVANAPLQFNFQGMTYNATTDMKGKAAVDNVPVAGPVGTDDLVVVYEGDDLIRSPTFKRAGFSVEEQATAISFEPTSASSGKVNHPAHFAAKLTDQAGPVSGATLRFEFQGASYEATTNDAGVAPTNVAVKGPAGATALDVRFDGDALRAAGSAHRSVVVTRDDSTLAFQPDSASSAKINDEAHVAARLTDSAGPVLGAQVHFDFQGSSYQATTNGDGVASRNVTVKGPAGDNDVEVSFAADASRASSSVRSTIAVARDDSGLAFQPDSASFAKINNEAHFEAKLTDSAGPVFGATVRFDFQGSSHEALTNTGGVASRDVTVKGPAGDTDLEVSFVGDASRAASSAHRTVVVTRDGSGVAFQPDSASSAKIGDDARFSAKLQDSNGPIAGATLHFDVQGSSYEATTNSAGVASVLVDVKGPTGETTATVRSDGDATREPSSSSTPFTVTKRNSSISFAAKSGQRSTVVVSVLLTDADTGRRLNARTVRVFVSGTKKATARTNTAGRSKTTLNIPNPQGRLFRVEFAPDSTHEGSVAQATFGKRSASGSS